MTVCKMGIVSKRATQVLSEEGYDATTLASRMSGWRRHQRGSVGYQFRSALWRLR